MVLLHCNANSDKRRVEVHNVIGAGDKRHHMNKKCATCTAHRAKARQLYPVSALLPAANRSPSRAGLPLLPYPPGLIDPAAMKDSLIEVKRVAVPV